MTETAKLISGVPVDLAGTIYIVPALNLRQVQAYEKDLDNLNSVDGRPNASQLDSMVSVMHAALSRNYPDFTKEQVAEFVDLQNMQQLIMVIMGVSGLVVDTGKQITTTA